MVHAAAKTEGACYHKSFRADKEAALTAWEQQNAVPIIWGRVPESSSFGRLARPAQQRLPADGQNHCSAPLPRADGFKIPG